MIKTKAIVLNRFDYKETDSMVSFYTLDFGRLNLIARGTKKQNSKLSAHLEPINFVDLMIIKNKNINTVGSAISRNSFLSIKNSYNSLYLSGSFLNFFNKIIRENQEDFNLFVFLNNLLQSIENNILEINKLNKNRLDFLLDIFKFKLIEKLGYSSEEDFYSLTKVDSFDDVYTIKLDKKISNFINKKIEYLDF